MKKKRKKEQAKKTYSLKDLITVLTLTINLIIAVINLIIVVFKI